MRRVARLAVVLGTLGLGLPAFAQAPQPPAPLPSPLPVLPPDNWWNQDVSTAPVDTNSAGFMSLIGNPPVHADFGGSDPDNVPNGVYGMIYAVVPGTTPLQAVDFEAYGYPDESDAGAPGRPAGYPIPTAARTEPRWVEGGDPADCSLSVPGCDGDRHMLLVDKDNRLLFELYQAHWNGSQWQAGSGAAWSLDSNDRRPEGWTSADAAGLAILPGLVRYDEVFGTDPIRHAFRVTVQRTNGHVWPASHTAGSSAGALPMGARLRLKAGKALGTLSPALQRVGQALKTYGLIVADNGSNMYVTGAYDPRWDAAPGDGVVGSWPFSASDFEVVQLGWRPVAPPDLTPRKLYTLTPCRLLDTRLSSSQPAPGTLGGPSLAANAERVITAAGRCGIPASARALAGNVTVANPAALGDLRLYPGDSGPPNASVLNFSAGKTRANNAVLPLAASGSGTLAIRNDAPNAAVNVILDVSGYFQ